MNTREMYGTIDFLSLSLNIALFYLFNIENSVQHCDDNDRNIFKQCQNDCLETFFIVMNLLHSIISNCYDIENCWIQMEHHLSLNHGKFNHLLMFNEHDWTDIPIFNQIINRKIISLHISACQIILINLTTPTGETRIRRYSSISANFFLISSNFPSTYHQIGWHA